MKFAFRHDDAGVIRFDADDQDAAWEVMGRIVEETIPQTSIDDWSPCEAWEDGDEPEGQIISSVVSVTTDYHFMHPDAGLIVFAAPNEELAQRALAEIVEDDFPYTCREEWKPCNHLLWWIELMRDTPQG